MVLVVRKDRHILRGEIVDDFVPVVRRLSPTRGATEILHITKLEKVLGACVHAEQSDHLGATLVEVLRMREAGEVVSIAHFLA